ncbi:Ribosomal protein S6 kinase beta-1, partial [Kappamyces sp. JEL0680]
MSDDEGGYASSHSSQELFAFDDINNPPESQAPQGVFEAVYQLAEQTSAITVRDSDQVVKIENFVSPDANGKGRVCLEDFNVISVVGKGAYGKVFLVQKKNAAADSAYYAMKVLKKATIVVHTKDAEYTMNERSILEAIKHPFIVKLFYAFQSPSKLYLILSYASGGELFTYLNKERMFTDDVCRFYVSELVLALEHLHSLGIIYRDLKPENIMLDSEGHLLLTDFGLSKVAVDAQSVCGTVEFMAPEILEERGQGYDRTVDFWSLGVMVFDMITGSPPFTGSNRKKIMEAVLKKKPVFPKYMTATTRDLCNKLLKKNPKVRLGSGPGGIQDIKNHAFFQKSNWKTFLAREVDPPYIPPLTSPSDLSNFAAEFTSMP